VTSPARKRPPRPPAEPPRRKRGTVKEYRVEATPPPDENPAAAQQILTWLARLARRR
jgi:hypothetical protein